ncbi:hypothetical protein [Pseudomonas sp. R37(2017)]|uniref:hypothetical protein n=1 Tax=Pseudomonas sp. R37(2017) TaxID=1981685 RepID=UPI000A1F2934|nr:hypothetical protein [Pseudomonas sp. R37(2017)]
MTAKSVSSLAQLEYGLGSTTRSVECRIGLEQVENDPFCFAIRVPAPLPEDLEQARTLVVRVEGRRLQGTVRRSECLEDGSLRLEVEPD